MSTRQVSDANEWSIRQHGDFVSDALRDAQPLQDNKRISDIIGALQIENVSHKPL